MATDWNDGRLITLKPGDTATCTALNRHQLYGLFLYNVALNDAGADLMVSWGASRTVQMHVPGTTGDQGLATLLFVSGDDTDTVAATMLPNQSGAQVQAFIGSVKMPVNTDGINNKQLPADGRNHRFTRFTRYFAVPESHPYYVGVRSDINQFISVFMREEYARVSAVNSKIEPPITAVGKARQQVDVEGVTDQVDHYTIQGDGLQYVWMNADSVQDSQSAEISLTSLVAQEQLAGMS